MAMRLTEAIALVAVAVAMQGCAVQKQGRSPTAAGLSFESMCRETSEEERLEDPSYGYKCQTRTIPVGVGVEQVEAAYAVLQPGCRYVKEGLRSDGALVAGHLRCRTRSDSLGYYSSYFLRATNYPSFGNALGGVDGAPCTSGCGPVDVNGYYRKDGTYVRPYSRRR